MDPPSLINRLSMVSHLALSINSSANLFVYVAGGSKFKKAFWRAQNNIQTNIMSMLDISQKYGRRYSIEITVDNKDERFVSVEFTLLTKR